MKSREPLSQARMLLPMPRAEIASIPLATHGALDYAELARRGIQPEDVVDFSENSNPFGPSPRVREALAKAIAGKEIAHYPDREALALRRDIAQHVGAPIDSILVGNGAAEIIWLISFAWLRAGDSVLILGPTFGEYARMARLMAAQVVELRSSGKERLAFPVGQVLGSLITYHPTLFFLCRPNNPTGEIVSLAELRLWAESFPETLFVIDEAYLDFVPAVVSAHALCLPNILVIRSMTKTYALAGLRLGYAVGADEIIRAMHQVRVPWSVNALALVAGRAALADQPHLATTLKKLEVAREEFSTRLADSGHAPHASPMNFQLIKVGNGAMVRSRLLTRGLVVRDCASFGLPEYIRVSTQLPESNRRLAQMLMDTNLPALPSLR